MSVTITNLDLDQLTIFRRLSLLSQTSPRRVGSSSKGPQALRAESPEEATIETAQPSPARQSKLMKTMQPDRVSNAKTPVKIDASTVYLEDLEVGVRG